MTGHQYELVERSVFASDWRCSLFGCQEENYYASDCMRCGSTSDQRTWVHYGLIWTVRLCMRGLPSYFRIGRCEVCRSVTGIGKNAPRVCSTQFCQDNWAPF